MSTFFASCLALATHSYLLVIAAPVVVFILGPTWVCGLVGVLNSEHTQKVSKAGFAENLGSQCGGGTDDKNATMRYRASFVNRPPKYAGQGKNYGLVGELVSKRDKEEDISGCGKISD